MPLRKRFFSWPGPTAWGNSRPMTALGPFGQTGQIPDGFQTRPDILPHFAGCRRQAEYLLIMAAQLPICLTQTGCFFLQSFGILERRGVT